MKDLKRTKVHMLPTDTYDIGIICKRIAIIQPNIHKNIKIGKLIINANPKATSLEDFQPQHLYFTTDEEIKEGDWFITDYRTLDAIDIEKCLDRPHAANPKLIADGVAQPSQAFIKAYCEQGGIDEVDVEYEKGNFKPDNSQGYFEPGAFTFDWKLKLNADNTVITHLIVEKMYSEQDLAKALVDFGNNFLKVRNTIQKSEAIKWIKENL
jgi:hypothetical protein